MHSPAVDFTMQYLAIDKARLAELQKTTPYDGKKNCWIPEEKDGFIEAEIIDTKGDEVVVRTSKNDVKTLKKDRIEQMNPPKFYFVENMADMTYLNDATVYFNLKQRYVNNYIYTYSGLFCVAINPYKRLPIYTPQIVLAYHGRRRNEVPPHVFAISENAYAEMLRNRENQSILITGESGAGKTENTKKVIYYFAQVASASQKFEDPADKKINSSLEDQIVQTNPILEAYGNAKTVRNNNSSRFGKFIRIHFGPTGKIAGADFETYLLEKSRVISQQKGERSYHVFYQLLSYAKPNYHERLLLQADASRYAFVNQGELHIDGVDDAEEMLTTDSAFDILGFTSDEKLCYYRCIAAILNMGEMRFKQRPKEEQAEADGTSEGEKVAYLLGINSNDLIKAFLKPKIKVGSDMMQKSQTKEQVVYAVGAICKSLYDRMFKWLVSRLNKTLATKSKRQYFIGVLDIAGFEIFDYNSFEQLCINYTNERLQQFFNHHMFVLEQEEYKKEGIQWEFIDFGLDLQACIDLIEKPMGILSILEEECMFPKSSDTTLRQKLFDNHMGKSPNFGKPKPPKPNQPEAHFELHHYAGSVPYNVTSWLEKNRDPLNENVVALLTESKEVLLRGLFPPPEPEVAGKKKKSGAYQTISNFHRESLNKLMTTLNSTQPHFIRCIIPNENKRPLNLDAHLVLNQLHCNGVLEGIRICRKGFPNRMVYADFKQRYSILSPNSIPKGFADGKLVSEKITQALQMDENEYRLGFTKIFFRAGVLGTLEEIRDERLRKIVGMFQAHIRGHLIRRQYETLCEQRVGLTIIQRNIRKYLKLRTWHWWRLFCKVKPMLGTARLGEELRKKDEELVKLKEEFAKVDKLRQELEEGNVALLQQRNDLFLQVQTKEVTVSGLEEKVEKLVIQKGEKDQVINELEEKIVELEDVIVTMEDEKRLMMENGESSKNAIQNLESSLARAEQEKHLRDNHIRMLNGDLAGVEDTVAKLQRDKKGVDELLAKTLEQLQAEEDKVNQLTKAKKKLEQCIEEAEITLEKEKKLRADLEKVKRKVEQDLKVAQDTIDEQQKSQRRTQDAQKKKDAEMNNLQVKIEDIQGAASGVQKKNKELLQRIQELEEELEQERQMRAKVEKQRQLVERHLDELNERLEEQGGSVATQAEINKRREAELAQLRRDLEATKLEREQVLCQMRKKNQDSLQEVSEQLDQALKAKLRLEKERAQARNEVQELQMKMEQLAKASSEKIPKQTEVQLADLQLKYEDAQRANSELALSKNKLLQENSSLTRLNDDLEHQVAQLTRLKQQLTSQNDNLKLALQEESAHKVKLQAEVKNLQVELESVNENLEEMQTAQTEAQRQVAKVAGDAEAARTKLEENRLLIDELDEMKRKLTQKNQELEEEVENWKQKYAQLDKVKRHLEVEVEDVGIDLERANLSVSVLERKQKLFDKQIFEWQAKHDAIVRDLEASRSIERSLSSEIMRIQQLVVERNDQIETLKRENKNLNDEVHDLTDQLGEGGRTGHEFEKLRKRLEAEKLELQAALEEAEAALEQEEAKNIRAQLEIGLLKSDHAKRLTEKQDEFDVTRKNHHRALESLQSSLEAEARARVDVMKQKQRLENELTELQTVILGATKQRSEYEKNLKKQQQTCRDLQAQLELEQRRRDALNETKQSDERRLLLVQAELEELRIALEHSERAKKVAESDKQEISEQISALAQQLTVLQGQKRKLESDFSVLRAELTEQSTELKAADERAKKAVQDAAHAAEELRQAQELVGTMERQRKQLESQLKEALTRLEEADAVVVKGGKVMMARLETRVLELESDLEAEQRRHRDTLKNMRKADHRIKELAFAVEEERKTKERTHDLAEKLNSKLKSYKRQLDEAEELAAVNLAKFRKASTDLQDAEERVEFAEVALGRYRVRSRSTTGTAAPMTILRSISDYDASLTARAASPSPFDNNASYQRCRNIELSTSTSNNSIM